MDGDALDDVGDRVRADAVDEDFGGFGVDFEAPSAPTTVPRSKGPTLAEVIETTRDAGAVVGAGQVDLAGDVGEDGADAGADQGAADL